jgi:RsmE family RNA methyltransferase
VNLLLLHSTELGSEGYVSLRGPRARHLVNVLKVAPEQVIRVGIIDGPQGTARVLRCSDGEVELACRLGGRPAVTPPVDLLLALPRPKVLQRLWAQFAALGVGQVILTNAAKVERHYFDTHVLDPAVYEPLLIEGLQQARDTRMPRVSVHRQFRILVEDELDRLAPQTRRIVAHPQADIPLASALRATTNGRVLLAIGPEGGWNAFELELLASRGFRAASMGDRTLRTDTACVALLAITHETLRAGSGLP